MFTTIDKAIAALVMAVLYLLNTFLGIDLGWSDTTINTIIAAFTPLLVWLVPNKPTS